MANGVIPLTKVLKFNIAADTLVVSGVELLKEALSTLFPTGPNTPEPNKMNIKAKTKQKTPIKPPKIKFFRFNKSTF